MTPQPRKADQSSLKALWSGGTAWNWRRAWREWLSQAAESGIPSLSQFARRLSKYCRGISRVRWSM
ncbi:DesA/ISL3 alpha bundle tail domain-containing protein [Motiliproteus sediminis]|uniref:DesA/ISL3 alpha bundle tail domain-containing protein n=1 Tax=Motiliproteus sediminis TaxID=1468178 RepID=UPI003CCEA1CC